MDKPFNVCVCIKYTPRILFLIKSNNKLIPQVFKNEIQYLVYRDTVTVIYVLLLRDKTHSVFSHFYSTPCFI